MALNLVMLGAPGAGKGTQAERFARARGIPRISTGDILREAVHYGTAVGGHAKMAMDRGELVSDELIIGIVRERLGEPDVERGFVLDGFPRTVAQAGALDAMMNGRSPLIVVDITVPEAELVRRLASRQVCEECGTTAGPIPGDGAVSRLSRCELCKGKLVQRSDDNEGIVRNRLRVYHHDTEPLVAYYRGRPTFRSIDGAQQAERVAMQLAAAVEEAAGLAKGTAR